MVERLREETGDDYVLDYDKYDKKYRLYIYSRGLRTAGLCGNTVTGRTNTEMAAYLEGIFAGMKQERYGEKL